MQRTRTLAALAVLGAVLAAAPSARGAAVSANDICPPATNPCVVTTTIAVAHGTCPAAPTVLDFGTRDLIVGSATRRGKLDVGSGCVRIQAGSFTLTALTGSFTAAGDSGLQVPAGSIDLELTGNATLDGFVDVHSPYAVASGAGYAAGTMAVMAGGAISVGPTAVITADATTLVGPGGVISLVASSGALTIASGSALTATGGTLGGTIELSAATDASIGSTLDVSGGTVGGQFLIDAGGDITITGQLMARGFTTGPDSSGGDIEVTTTSGSITISSPSAIGLNVSGNAGGGGTINIDAGAEVRMLTGVSAVSGDAGTAGEIDISAGTNVVINGALQLFGYGTDSAAGIARLSAISGDFTLNGSVLAYGSSAGEIDIDAAGTIRLGAVTLDLTAYGALNDGGVASVSAGRNLLFSAGTQIIASTHVLNPADSGNGGSVDLSGCDVTVPATDLIEVLGATGGEVTLVARERLTLAGSVATGDGSVTLGYRSGGPLPSVTGPVTPATAPVALPLPSCHVCGDGSLDLGEQCDDGNTADCDGCSSDCRIEACGNGVLDCGETCEDGNHNDCDGCSAACHIEVCGDGVLSCGEQCDDGNTSSGDGCSAGCLIEPPAAAGRIPGRGGSVITECMAEWIVENPRMLPDRAGFPNYAQICASGDPSCDFDQDLASPTGCTFRLWACANVLDPRFPCSPTDIASMLLRAPNILRPRDASELSIANAMFSGMRQLGPGATVVSKVTFAPALTGPQVCTGRMNLVVPLKVSSRGQRANAKAVQVVVTDSTGKRIDKEALVLRCNPPPLP
jgi:cysteine-rich repeat protein